MARQVFAAESFVGLLKSDPWDIGPNPISRVDKASRPEPERIIPALTQHHYLKSNVRDIHRGLCASSTQ